MKIKITKETAKKIAKFVIWGYQVNILYRADAPEPKLYYHIRVTNNSRRFI